MILDQYRQKLESGNSNITVNMWIQLSFGNNKELTKLNYNSYSITSTHIYISKCTWCYIRSTHVLVITFNFSTMTVSMCDKSPLQVNKYIRYNDTI